jgi:outer membrane immunogenic protein
MRFAASATASCPINIPVPAVYYFEFKKRVVPLTRRPSRDGFRTNFAFGRQSHFKGDPISMFKRSLFGFLLILIFVTVAVAQTEWKGFYAGGNIGGALGRSTADTSTIFSSSGYFAGSSVTAIESAGRQKLSANAFTGGLEAGINAQFGNNIFGGEVDYESLRLNDSQSSTLDYPCCAGTSFTVDQSFKTNWLLTARPRFGHAMGPALVYATGGLAVTKVDYEAQFADTFATASEGAFVNKAKYGWVGGFGLAFKGPVEHLSMKAEYLYTDFGRLTMTASNLTAFSPPSAFPSNVFTHSMALHAHVIRAGVDFHW